ncbi:uncharacterized protein TNCT_576351 [Trichonephila clavata]|uniref:Uncharacterized protein n=1 Tax=Trichonephila clavata TaxID=2740835 RepID=A0A8X6HXA0_TRICU|nr:uncharacterized protein TNCT_576351 [Trichonephila clavata]
MPPLFHHLGWLFGLTVLAATVFRPVSMQGLLSCSSNPCKNGASCVSNPRGESYCNAREEPMKTTQNGISNSTVLNHWAGNLKPEQISHHILPTERGEMQKAEQQNKYEKSVRGSPE